MDKMRESVFATLCSAAGSGDLSGASFLDLFSGSGVIALEAASRGAAVVEAVEADPLKRKILLGNVRLAEELDPPLRITCRFMAVELYIKRHTWTQRFRRQFDYIFCDPPFPYKFKKELLQSLAVSSLLKAETKVMIHRPREEDLAPIEGLSLSDSRRYGRSRVDFFIIDKKSSLSFEKSA
jgi:16S rRNA (guanine(966)-N(2))-methyltransferase RsmD